MAYIDLEPYGIFHTFKPSERIPEDVQVAKAEKQGQKLVLTDKTGKQVFDLTILNELGQGTSGTTFAVDGASMPAVVKIIPTKEFGIEGIVQEALMHIIVANAGPYAPTFIYMARDEENCYLISERLERDIKSVLKYDSSARILTYIIVELAKILGDLWDKLKFNHRDLKPDNIMFTRDGKLRLIDFGTSCLTYGGASIEPRYGYLRKIMEHCKRPSRDMKTFFNYFLYYSKYRSASPCPLKHIILGLMASGEENPTEWQNTYTAYNMEPELPNLFPENVVTLFSNLHFLGDDACSEIEPSWVLHIAELNKGIMSLMTKEEFNLLPKERVLNYLRTYPSVRIFSLVLKKSDNAEIKEFCETGLEDVDLELDYRPKNQHNNDTTVSRFGGRRRTRKGIKRTKNKTRRF